MPAFVVDGTLAAGDIAAEGLGDTVEMPVAGGRVAGQSNQVPAPTSIAKRADAQIAQTGNRATLTGAADGPGAPCSGSAANGDGLVSLIVRSSSVGCGIPGPP
jgi:hypothetical protein